MFRSPSPVRALALVLLASMALGGCGPSPSAAATRGEDEVDNTGGETLPPTPLSYLPDDVRVRMRIDVTRIRRSPAAPDLGSALMATESFRAWAGSSGLDPIRDLDAVLIGGDALYTNRRVIVMRYVGDEAALRDRILRMGIDRGVTPVWREVQGFAVVDYPDASLPVPHVMVLTAPHELVLAPSDDLDRVIGVAQDHAARRTSDEVIEPQFAFQDHEVMSVESQDAMPTYPGYPEGPARFTVRMTDDEDGTHADLDVHAEFTTEEACTNARTYLETQRATYADHMLVRAAQLDRPLREATFTQAGNALDIHADFTSDELRRALGALALFQASRGGS